jgi:hypothetical protein
MSAVAWVSIIVAPFWSSIPQSWALFIASDIAKTGTAERVLTMCQKPDLDEATLGNTESQVALPYGRASDTLLLVRRLGRIVSDAK